MTGPQARAVLFDFGGTLYDYETLAAGDRESLLQLASLAGANRAGLRSVLLWHRSDREPPPDGERPRHVIRKIPDVLELVG